MTFHSTIRSLIPLPVSRTYHFALAKMAAVWYRYPSEQLRVIGVTGTNGKTSTVQFIAQILEMCGYRTGYVTTAGFSFGGNRIENRLKMTMPGRWYLEAQLRKMVEHDCRYAIVETSSQGIAQYRHLGINYDTAVFTNLTPEHVEAHGGFDHYRRAKGLLFSHLVSKSTKIFDGQEVEKTIIVNDDDPHAEYFARFPSDRTIRFGWGPECPSRDRLVAHYTANTVKKTEIEINGVLMKIPMRASYQHRNILAAVSTVYAQGIPLTEIAEAVSKLQPIPGRFEIIEGSQPFTVMIDYAYEPYALRALFEAVHMFHPRRLIGVHGSAGGGRDQARRLEIGKCAAENESVVIVTNEDPYDDNPREIMEAVAEGAKLKGKKVGKNLFLVNDRIEAIEKAIELGRSGDHILVTGKGSEPVMAVAHGKKIPWSDRDAVENALTHRGYGN
ncbi:MAG: UDP-N-acetylmuramyl-tripeptide synthetase [Patescibacteria group bacterium]|jgi:UDP-N-acetylmuramoyl-L-alanyl-D-glutamate--2,6-diaminopimelate ligase